MKPRLAQRRVLACLAIALAASAAQASVDPQGLARARSAANAGDRDTAIALYEDLLRAAPDDPMLLAESAQQLSWDGRYDEAVRRYERVLERDPANRFAALERAKVLSWSGRYDEAAAAFNSLLEGDPSDLDSRLGLARTLSWSGRQEEARAGYRSILADHPGLGEATLGLAQTHAWSGDLARARALYEQARTQLRDPRDAELGLGYVALWQGRLPEAQATATGLAARHPGDRDVAALQREINRTIAPWVAASWDQLDDTDRNLLSVGRLEGGARLPGGLGIGLARASYDITTAGFRGSIDSLQATGEWSPRWRHKLEGMVGLDRLETPTSSGETVVDWGLAYRFPAGDTAEGRIGIRREPYRYSVPLIVNQVVVRSLFAGLEGTLGQRWRVAAEAESWDVSDGNRRVAASLAARHRWTRGSHALEAGAAARWLDWEQDRDNGYFDPSNFSSFGATGRAFGPVRGVTDLDYDVTIELGLQSFDTAGSNTRADPYYLVAGRLFWQFNAAGRLELYGEAGSYASQGSEDWRYSRAGARLFWRFGTGR